MGGIDKGDTMYNCRGKQEILLDRLLEQIDSLTLLTDILYYVDSDTACEVLEALCTDYEIESEVE